ncbi:hypothetical protein EPR50_G00091760 [Perca flavescens]|uniref:Uncharacterized protein n=1 Tax=Perca flavescens TaxID=8167 RepID=A0A484D3H3_PERFV|nr:uncharacterized protein LOC114560492 isoform X2 [Perca flavescens]TDH09858.1 hypothetical protein EPR50_G00091760 [Perca flavescens]
MIGSEVVLEALSEICHAGVTSAQRRRSQAGLTGDVPDGAARLLRPLQTLQLSVTELTIHDLIPLTLCGDTSCHSRSAAVSSAYQDGQDVCDLSLPKDIRKDNKTGGIFIDPNYQWSKEHLDPKFDYDFTKLRDTKEYYRGEEKYKRPCGWQRFALKVLDEFGDNTWLGNNNRRTQSVPGEWPVSYHGTQEKFVKAIIEENYKKGVREAHGPGIYSTPNIDEAEKYAHEFTSKTTGKKYKTVLQNRINPKYREICRRKDYWLVRIDHGTSKEKEKEIVRKAIRPYGLLLKEM